MNGGSAMPNIITHKIFAEEVLKNIAKKDIKDIIEKNSQIYYIGSNGPDFLFFYHAKPWEALKNHELNKIGSMLHKQGVNAFYTSAVASIKKEKSTYVKEQMLAYLFGHLCHWALDKYTHPYIFYRTGDCTGISSGYHHKFESMMDTMMLYRYRQLDIKQYPFYKICEYDEEMLKAIARIYVPAIKATLNEDIKVYDLRQSLNEWYEIQKLLYDPKNMKMPLLKGIEKIINQPNLISGNIVPKKLDETYDILNLNQKEWSHPCNAKITSNASFIDLFNQAVQLAVEVLKSAYGCIEYDTDILSLCNILKDEAYDTGMSNLMEMKHFDIIYEEEQNENI